jgi:hypothetical protein
MPHAAACCVEQEYNRAATYCGSTIVTDEWLFHFLFSIFHLSFSICHLSLQTEAESMTNGKWQMENGK